MAFVQATPKTTENKKQNEKHNKKSKVNVNKCDELVDERRERKQMTGSPRDIAFFFSPMNDKVFENGRDHFSFIRLSFFATSTAVTIVNRLYFQL